MVVNAKSGTVERVLVGRVGVGRQALAFMEVLLLALWIGAMAFFSFAVAPGAFQVLPSRHLAGLIVANTLTKVEMIGLIIGPLLLLLQAATWNARRESKISKALRLILLAVMTASAAVSRLWVSASINELRNAMGGVIDNVPATDPLRVQFNDLHQYSVALMSVALFSGLAVLFLTVRAWLKR